MRDTENNNIKILTFYPLNEYENSLDSFYESNDSTDSDDEMTIYDSFIKRYTCDSFSEDISADEWLQSIINYLAPVAKIKNTELSNEIYFYIFQNDVLPFLYEQPDLKVFIISNSFPIMFLSLNEFKEKYNNAELLYVIMHEYQNELLKMVNIKSILSEYCKQSGNFNSLTELLKSGSFKNYTLSVFNEWAGIVETAIQDFQYNFSVIPRYLIANHKTFENIGFLGNYEFEINDKIFFQGEKRFVFDDIFPNLDFVFSEIPNDNEFLLLYDDNYALNSQNNLISHFDIVDMKSEY